MYCVIVIKHISFFTICAKLQVTMAFTFTFPDVIVVPDLKKNIGESTDLAEERWGLHIHPIQDYENGQTVRGRKKNTLHP